MYIGKKNNKFQYSIGSETENRYWVNVKLNISSHCQTDMQLLVRQTQYIIKCAFNNLNKDIFTNLYNIQVVCGVRTWGEIYPYLKEYNVGLPNYLHL